MPFSPNLISRALSHRHGPMEVEDGMTEGSASSLVLGFLEANNREVLSPENIAWIHSCLVNDSSFIERNWDVMREALMEIFYSRPGYFQSAVLTNFHRRIHSENFSTRIAEPANFQGERTNCDDMLIEAETSEARDYTLAKSGMFRGNVCQPNYSNDLEESRVIVFGFPADETEPSAYTSAGIFNSQPKSFDSAASGDNSSIESIHSSEEVKCEDTNCKMAVDDNITTAPEVFDDVEETRIRNNTVFGNPFWSDHSDDLPGNKFIHWGLDVGFSPYQNEPSTEDISRLWDLNTSMEGDVFIKKWSKAFEECSTQSEPLNIFNKRALSDTTAMSIGSLDDGVKKLSLNGCSS